MADVDKTPPRHRVLIVDDEEATRLLLARILTSELNVEVQLAGTCEQALRLAEEYAYDAIVLALLMPGISRSTPVVVVTVMSDPNSKDQCLEAGANAYLVKPIERATLAATVKAQIAGRKRAPRAKS